MTGGDAVRELAGQRVLVTGASSGIGADLARRLAAGGATVAIAARREDRLDEVLADCRTHAPDSRAFPVDLSDLDAAARLVDDAWGALGGLDAVVNNAAAPKRRHVAEMAFDEVAYIDRLNYLSPVRICLALLPRMLANGGGTIVNVASTAGRVPAPREAAYSASKAALSLFTEGMAIDLHGTPVRTFLVQPGPIDTEIWQVPGEDPSPYDGPRYPPGEVSAVIVEMLTADGPLERWVPPELAAVATAKAQDPDAYIAGAAAWADAAHA
jgi:NAD(P)-dependent dehydrogenase (short-subunit alcohol dehydrogenase family)